MDFDIDISSELFDSPCSSTEPAGKADCNEAWVFSAIHEVPIPNQQASFSKTRIVKKKVQRVDIEFSSDESCDSESEDGDSGSDCEWQAEHASVGKKIVKYFELQGKSRPFVGQVTAYLPATSFQANDQLYRIEYDDEDTEDLDQSEFEQVREAFHCKYR